MKYNKYMKFKKGIKVRKMTQLFSHNIYKININFIVLK